MITILFKYIIFGQIYVAVCQKRNEMKPKMIFNEDIRRIIVVLK